MHFKKNSWIWCRLTVFLDTWYSDTDLLTFSRKHLMCQRKFLLKWKEEKLMRWNKDLNATFMLIFSCIENYLRFFILCTTTVLLRKPSFKSQFISEIITEYAILEAEVWNNFNDENEQNVMVNDKRNKQNTLTRKTLGSQYKHWVHYNIWEKQT